MKRFGLKAIAASLALLMTASLSAPAAAEAADKLLITSAGSNVLVITQDMVDSEGEFVLSGEDFDKVVLPADVEIKNLYVDGCEIGEFTVEGGNNPKVQLWDAQIKNVTVSAPSLVDENKAIAEYLDLYKGKESAEDFDVDGFFKNVRETNERLNSLVPEIRLMGADMESSEQAIGAVTLAGNAKVNFTKGKTPDAVNVAFNSAQMKMDVTIEGYKGDINVDQTTGKENAFGILNIKTKKSEIGNVNVKAQGNANIALRSSDSKAATVNFDSKGDASAVLTVAAPTDNLKVAGSASNATVKVLTSLISADIQGKSITMDLGPAASVETATIAGSGNVVSGSGDLVDCTIAEGTSAAVQIPGAAVAGDNSYQPIISAPSVGGGSSSGGSTGGNTGNTGGNTKPEVVTVAYDYSEMTYYEIPGDASQNAEKSVDENGVLTATFTGQFKSVAYKLPEALSADEYKYLKLDGEFGGQICLKVWMVDEEGSGGNPTCKTWDYKAGEAFSLSAIAGNSFDRIDIMSMAAGTEGEPYPEYTAVVNKVIFAETAAKLNDVPSDGGAGDGGAGDGEGTGGSTGTNPPSGETEAENVSYTFLALNSNEPTHNNTTAVETENGVKITYSAQYTQSIFKLPTTLAANQYKAVKFTVAGDGANEVQFELRGEDKWNDKIAYWKVVPGAEATEYTFDFDDCYDPATYGPSSILDLDAQVYNVMVQANTSAGDITVVSVEFISKNDAGSSNNGSGSTSAENISYTFLALNKTEPTHNNTTATETENGVKITYSAQYTQSIFKLSNVLAANQYKAVKFTVAGDGANEVQLELRGEDKWNDKIAYWKVVPGAEATEYTFDFDDCYDPATYGPSSILDLDAQVYNVMVQANTSAGDITVVSIEFIAK